MKAIEFYSTRLLRDRNLIAYYRLEGNSLATIGSASGTDTGAVYSTVYGKFGQGVSCAGSGSNNIDFGAKVIPAGAKTISFWYQSVGTTTNAQQILDTNQQNVASNNGTTIYTTTDGNTMYWGEGPGLFTLTINVPDANKHIYTLTWDGTTNTRKAIAYIDGIPTVFGTSTSATQAAGFRNMCMGGISGFSYPLKGYLDDVIIMNRALNSQEAGYLANGWGRPFLL